MPEPNPADVRRAAFYGPLQGLAMIRRRAKTARRMAAAEPGRLDFEQPRILVEYAKWTARAAVAAGAPIRDRETVYRLLDGVAFGEVLSGAEVSAER